MPRWVALNEGAGGTIGFLTTNQTKEASCFMLRDALSVGNIALSNEFFSNTMGERDAVAAIKDELERFAIVVEPARTLFGKARRARPPARPRAAAEPSRVPAAPQDLLRQARGHE